MATLYKRGQGILSSGGKRREKKGCWRDHNHNMIIGWFHCGMSVRVIVFVFFKLFVVPHIWVRICVCGCTSRCVWLSVFMFVCVFVLWGLGCVFCVSLCVQYFCVRRCMCVCLYVFFLLCSEIPTTIYNVYFLFTVKNMLKHSLHKRMIQRQKINHIIKISNQITVYNNRQKSQVEPWLLFYWAKVLLEKKVLYTLTVL